MATKTRRLADLLANIDDNSKVTSAGLLDATITADDLAANSVGASELADNAVDQDAIADDAVGADQLASNAVTTVKIANDAVDADKLASNAVVTASIVDANITNAKMGSDIIEVKPHIVPGVLYPALKDSGGTVRLSDGITAINASATTGPAGSTITASAYGTVQADGRMYYYTDIQGSKPIKDPRIGAHFGSHRHKIKSLQKLDQETASHGEEIYSVDGREWMRFANHSTNVNAIIVNGSSGAGLQLYDNDVLEVVGYFNDANLYAKAHFDTDIISAQIDGGTAEVTDYALGQGAGGGIGGRFVEASSGFRISFDAVITSPGIHTLRLEPAAGNAFYWYAIELIAQDTTSSTTKSQIQIQPQNVVSYGKKYTVAKEALHYNPFAFKTDGTTAWASGAHNGTGWPVGTGSSHNIDTATSLGLNKWLHSSNYYKPYNGGRVVIWVDSSGSIKTSVTVMPPNARGFTGSAISAKANASIANNTYLPTFETGSVSDFETTALAEVAKEFHIREFGIGAANGGTTASTNKADMSMLGSTSDNVGYIFDDGLTAFSGHGQEWNNSEHLKQTNDGQSWHITFIGTGITIGGKTATAGKRRLAQNLPYGSHILKITRENSSTGTATLDGVALQSGHANFDRALLWDDVTFHQPKRPPIPENAVVLADYMLMADFVLISGSINSGAGLPLISKGVRTVNCSRDHLLDQASSAFQGVYIGVHTTSNNYNIEGTTTLAHNNTASIALPFFGKQVVFRGYNPGDRCAGAISMDGTVISSGIVNNGNAWGGTKSGIIASDIGSHFWKGFGTANKDFTISGTEVACHIHTSSHYQNYETPWTNELVGGDRNMEQTNLVVTADGKSWDEVTRDTSYISDVTKVVTTTDTNTSWTNYVVFSHWRGTTDQKEMMCKDFAISYDRLICLVDGIYHVSGLTLSGATDTTISILKNGSDASYTFAPTNDEVKNFETTISLVRGDEVQLKGEFGHGPTKYNLFTIRKA